tara:strand:+ start:12474 stop:13238 length:765 start_codon:yes stop_codon:yes gene_type:complete
MAEGLRVAVTAGAAGIGRAFVEAFDETGAKIHVCDVVQGALDSCKADHPDWHYTQYDVSDEDQVKQLFAEVKGALGGLDVLVNNAGIAGPTGGIDEISTDEWRQIININLNGKFYSARYAVPMLRESRNASIVSIASVAGRLAYANRTPYAASKWAIRGFTESLAWELGGDGIWVNAILPGIVEGPRIDKVIQARADKEGVTFDEMSQQYKDMASLRKMVTAQDVAAQILFLCSESGRNISGQSISVDGHVRAL